MQISAGKGRAGGRLDRNNPVVGLSAQLLAHKGGYQPAEVGALAGAADDNIGFDIVHVELPCTQPDNRLVQHCGLTRCPAHSGSPGIDGDFYRLGNRAAKRAGCPGEPFEHLAAYLGLV